MKIHRFTIKAFGPFTDRDFDFSGNTPGLHIIYGPNEAGKSSSLRALKAWLFGFPERTTDNFLHPSPQLLVGGTLKQEDGTMLSFFRRKKRVADIVDASGSPLSPSLLEPFLFGLDSRIFELLYGLDHDSLLKGGRDLLTRHGEIGQALFSAGAGMTSLHDILTGLEQESNGLYRARAAKPAINQAITLHKQLKKKIRDLSLPPEEWRKCYEGLQEIQQALQEREAQRRELARELHYLERLEQALPLLVRRKKLRRLLAEKGTVRLLPENFPEKRIAVEKELEKVAEQLRQAENRRHLLQKKTSELIVDAHFLERAEHLEQQLQRLGEYEKALRDRPRLEGIQAMHRREGERLLNLVWPGHTLDEADSLLPLYRQRKTILDLVSRHKVLLQAVEDSGKRLIETQQRLQDVENKIKKLSTLPETQPLQLAIHKALRIGDVDGEIEARKNEILNLKSVCSDKLQQLGLWQGTLESLPDTNFPSSPAVGRYVESFREMEREEGTLIREGELAVADQERCRMERKQLEYGGGVPEEGELRAVRRKRDKGWQLIRRAWLDQEEIEEDARQWDEEDDLAGTFQDLVLKADTLSDRLRFEADRVQAYAAIKAREEEIARQLARIAERREVVASQLAALHRTWQGVWKPNGIFPLAPAEMVAWLADMTAIRHQAVEIRQLEQRQNVLVEKRLQAVSVLRRELQSLGVQPPDGEQLATSLFVAEEQLKKMEQLADDARELYREGENHHSAVREAKRELEKAEKAYQVWLEQWNKDVKLPDHNTAIPPLEAADYLDYIGLIVSAVDNLRGTESRIKGIDRDCLSFAKEVENLVREIAPDTTDTDVSSVMAGLRTRLNRVRHDHALRVSYAAEMEELALEISGAREEEKMQNRHLAELCSVAGCAEKKGLILAEQEARDYGRLTAQSIEIENDLLPLTGDMDPEAFEALAANVDSDEIPGRIHELRRTIEQECDPEIRRLAERKGEEQKVLAQMDGSTLAAEKAEEVEQNLARLGGLVERYVRLQLAGRLLRREIEQFRIRYQDPVLRIASEFFATLTMRSFSGLGTDMDDKGEPILVGLRDTSRLAVEAMSTGTRDQLHLSLRLATLRQRAESGQTMPLIVDDILINFDDARAKTTLEVLAELGRVNQVILFTHHRQLVREGEALADHGVRIHHLDS